MPWRSIEHSSGSCAEKTSKQNPTKIPHQVWNCVSLPRNVLVQPGEQRQHGKGEISAVVWCQCQDSIHIISLNPQDSVMQEPVPFHRQETKARLESPAFKITELAASGAVPMRVRGPARWHRAEGVATWALPDAACATLSPAFSAAGNAGRSKAVISLDHNFSTSI